MAIAKEIRPMRSEGAPLLGKDSMLWVGDIPSHWMRVHPDKAAIIVPETGRTLRYADLASMSAAFAMAMRAKGLVAGDRIAYLGPNSDLFFVALFGSIAGGFVLVPLNWRCAAPELAFMLSDADAALVLVDDAFDETLRRAIAGDPGLSDLQTLSLEGGGALRETVSDPGGPSQTVAHDPDQVCLQLYTSGTTGRPKGVLCTHGGLSYARLAELNSTDWSDWTSADISLSALPNFHIGGMSWMLIGLVRGLTCILTADASTRNILDLADRYGVTRTFIVPTVIADVLDHIETTGRKPPAFRTITYGAAVMTEALLRRAINVLGCQFGQYFGMTEVTGTIAFLAPRDHDLNRPWLLKSVGRPQHGVAIEIRDPDGAPLAYGEAGEIWARTPTLMAGYWNLPEATAAAIHDGWYRTGDGGRLDEAGYLYLTDRIRDMIISGGENVYPAEVEIALRRHPAVQDVAVVGLPDARWGEAVVAVVELGLGQSEPIEAEVIAFARDHVAGYKSPRRVVFTRALPRTAMGKVQRAAVRSDLIERQ